MPTAPTFAAALVGGLRARGHRPSGPDGRRWSALADEARAVALGLVEAGIGPGTAIRVRSGAAATPAALLAAEVAVLAAGAALAVDDGAGAEVALDGSTLRGLGPDRPLADLRAAGADLDRRHPDAHEERLAAVEPGDVALLGDGLVVPHDRAVWALRCVTAWIGPVGGEGPRAVLAPPPVGPTVAAALLGRWWPATAGAALVAEAPDPVAAARAHRPDVVVGDGTTWAALVDAVRAEAGRTRSGAALLRQGRALVAGEVGGRAVRAARSLAERRAGDRVRAAAGLDALALGICLGPLEVATGRDLAAAGLPVVATWIDPAVPAPVAAGPRARPAPAEPWGRPLPGRSVAVGPPTVVHGGDVGPDGVPTAPLAVDDRGRLRLHPRPPAGAAEGGR